MLLPDADLTREERDSLYSADGTWFAIRDIEAGASAEGSILLAQHLAEKYRQTFYVVCHGLWNTPAGCSAGWYFVVSSSPKGATYAVFPADEAARRKAAPKCGAEWKTASGLITCDLSPRHEGNHVAHKWVGNARTWEANWVR